MSPSKTDPSPWLAATCVLAALVAPTMVRAQMGVGPDYGRYHALLISVDDYADDEIADLRTPGRDVRKLEQILRETYAFDAIEILADRAATADAIKSKLRSGYASLNQGDNLLVYYSGHGALDGDRGFWVPHDGAADDSDGWVDVKRDVLTPLGAITARHTLLISDSCFSGTLVPYQAGVRTVFRTPDVIERPSYQVITAGSLEEVSDRLDNIDHSPFAEALLYELAFAKAPLTSSALFGTIEGSVRNLSARYGLGASPQFGTIEGAPDKGGEFVFSPEHSSGVLQFDEASVEGTALLDYGYRPVEIDTRHGELTVFRTDLGNDRVDGDLADMVRVMPPQGRVRLGEGDDAPFVRLRPFLIDRYEVSIARFEKFVNETGVGGLELKYWNRDGYRDPRQPVVGISLQTARAFAAWAGKQIPTELEWEYAARVLVDDPNQRRVWPWGEDYGAGGVVESESLLHVDNVRADVSPWHLVGMGSSVREWCELPFGDERRLAMGVIRGPSQYRSGRRKFLGGEWDDWRVEARPDELCRNLGFRCVIRLR